VLSVSDPLGAVTRLTYDANRNLIQVRDAKNHITNYSYDLDNERTATVRADGSVTKTTYGGNGKAVAQIDGAGNTTSYAYDPLDRVISMTDPLGRVTRYSYDPRGNRLTLTDAQGQTTASSYDAANELVGIAFSDGTTSAVSFVYDAAGRRISMTDQNGTSLFGYDSLGRLMTNKDAAGNTTRYSYDLANHLTRLTYPNGLAVTRRYNPDGLLAAVTDWLGQTTDFGYDSDLNLTRVSFPNGVETILSYDATDRISQIVDTNPSDDLAAFNYERDSLGQVTIANVDGIPRGSDEYQFTALNQVASSKAGRYAYDNADNLTRLANGTVQSFDAANELLKATRTGDESDDHDRAHRAESAATTYSYDPRGNRVGITTAAGTTLLSYDQANRLTAYGKTATYSYDGDGLRTSKTVGGSKRNFTWARSGGLPLLLMDGADAYVYGPGALPIERITGTTATYLHQDQLGSTRLLTDQSGSVIATYSYGAYGNTMSHTGTGATPIQFAGEYRDEESGLTYLRARYYDPATGQFLTRDPVVQSTRAAYSYVAGNPVNAKDPSGLDVCDAYAEQDLCKKTLQYCATNETADECWQVAQQTVDTYNVVTSELACLEPQLSSPTGPYWPGVAEQVQLLKQAQAELQRIYDVITTQALPNFGPLHPLPSPDAILGGVTACVSGGLAGAEFGATFLWIPVGGEALTVGGAVFGCALNFGVFAATEGAGALVGP
jgi:RHS repeat-associated protein